MAQDIVREDHSYKFAHGKSRSKKVVTPSESEAPKREKIDLEERRQRINTLQEQIKDVNKHVVLKERRIEQSQGIHNYKLCDQLMEEVDSLKSRRSDLESSLRTLQRKDKRSARYFAYKNAPLRPDTSVGDTSVGNTSTEIEYDETRFDESFQYDASSSTESDHFL